MWRCWECGEMGKLDTDLPEACPACGAAKEDLYYWTED
jgi:rubrerythrin